MENEITLEISLKEEVYEKANKNSLEQNIKVEEYIEKLVEDDVSIVRLDKGFIYKGNEKKLYSSNKENIVLTRREEIIMELLIKNPNQVVSLETFYDTVWGNKKRSKTVLYSLRNFIKSIRDKTDYELIKSISGVGYLLECS